LRDPAQPKNRGGGGIAHNIFLVSRLEEKKHCANADCRPRELAGDPDPRTGQALAKAK
jgi:hypothetical protein